MASLRSLSRRLPSATRSATRSLASSKPKPPPPNLTGLERYDVLRDEPHNTRRVTIDAIGPDSFTVNGLRFSGSVFLLPHVATLWNTSSPADLVPPAFTLAKIFLPRPDIVVVGTGRAAHRLSSDLRAFFASIGVSVDAMDTTNACHTFNVLNQEGRNVAAALLPESAE